MNVLAARYDKEPAIAISGWRAAAWKGYPAIKNELKARLGQTDKTILTIECYPAVREREIVEGLSELNPVRVIFTEEAALDRERLNEKLERFLTDDRVFGYMAPYQVEDFYSRERLEELRKVVAAIPSGLVILIGFGASLVTRGDILLYADLARWEIQLRYRSMEFGNWMADNHAEDMLKKYKRGYFIEWRAADRLKRDMLREADYYLDTNGRNDPKMITAEALFEGFNQTCRRPFRLVPYFDPGVWGGVWLQENIGLEPQDHPYAWGFDGVPEENSLYFEYGDVRLELPAINLVFFRPNELLGEQVYARFGAEFPIRFDFLDTIDGQNLSLQVHPLTDYIQRKFGMHYTQDESYYMLDAQPGAVVYLGLKSGIDPEDMMADLEKAQEGVVSFPAEKYVNVFPAKKHDHFLIPAGTVHCSGSNGMVLEISATPYIFTFKLWDWNRLGLDGKPRPVHLQHGRQNIQWDRTTEWTAHQLVNQVEKVAEGDGWVEERTGLHELEFIETRRHWFSGSCRHDTNGGVQVLNLVEGEEAIVESPSGAFEPFTVHYAETFIIPAAIGPYNIRPGKGSHGKTLGTIKAYVRN